MASKRSRTTAKVVEYLDKKTTFFSRLRPSAASVVSKATAAIDGSTKTVKKAKQFFVSVFKKSAYWSSVFVVGGVFSLGILHYSGVPIIESANAVSLGQVLFILITNLIQYLIIMPLGLLVALMAYIMEVVINYPHGVFFNENAGGFVNVSGVKLGWKLVRDVCNVFFSLILVIIALATVLKIESYSWKQLLPKFILMAILINFSKSIAGVFTDLATVAMATFGGSFSGQFASGLIGAFGLPEVGKLNVEDDPSKVSANSQSYGSLILAYIAAAVMMVVFFVVILVFTLTLIFRIIMLWFLIVLSPLAYISRILPQTQKYSSQWWEMFGRYVVVGPLVTFFLWLSLSMAFATDEEVGSDSGGGTALSQAVVSASSNSGAISQTPPQGASVATTPSKLSNFLIATMMLMASLKLIHQMAAEFGGVISKVEGAAWSAGKEAAQFVPAVLPGATRALLGRLGTAPQALMTEEKDEEGNTVYNEDGTTKMTELRDDSGNVMYDKGSAGYRFSQGAQRVATFTGTMLQPVDFIAGAYTGFKKSAAEFKRNRGAAAREQLTEMRNAKVTGVGSALGNVAGIIGGLGVDQGMDSKHIWDRYGSISGVVRMGKLAWAHRRGGMANERDDVNKELNTFKDEQEKEDKEGAALTQEEARKKEKEQKDAASSEASARAIQEALETGGHIQLDLDDGNVQAAIDEMIARLQTEQQGLKAGGNLAGAKKVGDTIKNLQDVKAASNGNITDLERQRAAADDGTADGKKKARKIQDEINRLRSIVAGGKVSTHRLENTAVGDLNALDTDGKSSRTKALRNNLTTQFKGRADTLNASRRTIEGQLKATGYQFNAQGQVTQVGSNFMTDGRRTALIDSRDKRKEKVDQLNAKKIALDAELASLKAGVSYESRTETQSRVSEEMRKIAGIQNSREIMTYLASGKREKNPYLVEACMRRITELADDNEVYQAMMAYDRRTGQWDTAASSGAEGAENFRKKFLMQDVGMNRDQSITLMNDLSYIAEARGHIGLGRKYVMDGGEWRILSEKEREASSVGEMRKLNIRKYLDWNRLAWGHEDYRRQFQLSAAGLQLLQSAGKDMADQRMWKDFNSNAKMHLSRPEIVAQLERAGVHVDFIKKLREYRTNMNTWGSTESPAERFAA